MNYIKEEKTMKWLKANVILERELFKAVDNENLEKVKKIIKSGVDVNSMFKIGWTPLMKAIITKNKEMIKTLIDAGANVNAKSSDMGFTPIMIAIGHDFVGITKILLNNGADISIKDKEGHTPLMQAKEESIPQIVKLLKDKEEKTVTEYKNEIEEKLEKKAQEQNENVESVLNTPAGKLKKVKIKEEDNTAYYEIRFDDASPTTLVTYQADLNKKFPGYENPKILNDAENIVHALSSAVDKK